MSENRFESSMVADVSASVVHHAPCVPECPVCYPPDQESAE